MKKILSQKDVNGLKEGQILVYFAGAKEIRFAYLSQTGTPSVDYVPGSELSETIDGINIEDGRDVHITMQDAGALTDRGYPSANLMFARDQILSKDEIADLKKLSK